VKIVSSFWATEIGTLEAQKRSRFGARYSLEHLKLRDPQSPSLCTGYCLYFL